MKMRSKKVTEGYNKLCSIDDTKYSRYFCTFFSGYVMVVVYAHLDYVRIAITQLEMRGLSCGFVNESVLCV